MYDATLGRFANIDPLADIPFQLAKSPYQFGWNNPILYFDPSGECPCFALPWIIAAIEALTATTAVAVTGYVAYEIVDDFDFDRSKLRTHRGEADYRVGGEFGRGGGDPEEPYFTPKQKAAAVLAATAALTQLTSSQRLNWDKELIELVTKAFDKMSPEQLDRITAAYSQATHDGYYDRVQQLTDRQLFGAINPLLSEAASLYNENRSLYDLNRPWLTDEEKAQQKEERNRGEQANELLNQAEKGDLEAGLYTWNGSNWVKN